MNILGIFLFLVIFGIILLAISVGLRFVEGQKKDQLEGMLKSLEVEVRRSEVKVLKERNASPLDSGRALFANMGFYSHLENLLRSGASSWHPVGVIIAMLALAGVGALAGYNVRVLVFKELSAAALALALGFLPYFIVKRKSTSRLNEFEAQFPEALDFLARSMKAGHAFSVSLEMLSAESPEPLATEFRRVFNENNLGAPLDVALYNLSDRVPSVDVRFFVSAVMLQRETGGNLGEILMNLSRVIRERFRLRGQVRAASAHGRLTATVLIILPVFMMLALFVVAPGYLDSMAEDEHGKWMIVGAIVGQLLGFYFIRKIIDIKV
jgi:tight adherence protein B